MADKMEVHKVDFRIFIKSVNEKNVRGIQSMWAGTR